MDEIKFGKFDTAAEQMQKLALALNKLGTVTATPYIPPTDPNLEALLVEVNKRIENAYNEGYAQGHTAGYDEGYSDGFEDGRGI